ALGFRSNHPEHLRLRGSKPDIIPDAEKNRFGRAALLDDEGPALIFNPAQKPPEIGTRPQRRHDYRLILGDIPHNKLFSSIVLNCTVTLPTISTLARPRCPSG